MKNKLNVNNKLNDKKILSNFYNENQYMNKIHSKKMNDFTILQKINDKLNIIISKGKDVKDILNIKEFFIVNEKGDILKEFENRHIIYNPKIIERNIDNNMFFTIEGNINKKDKNNHIFGLLKKDGEEIKTIINGSYCFGYDNANGPIFDNFIYDGENIIMNESNSVFFKQLKDFLGKQLFVFDKEGKQLFNGEYNCVYKNYSTDPDSKLKGVLDYKKTEFGYMIGTNKTIYNQTHNTDDFHYEVLDKNGNDLITNKKLKHIINYSGGIKEIEKINDNIYALNVSTHANCAFTNVYMGQILVDNKFEPIFKYENDYNIFSDIEKTKDGWKCKKINKVGLEQIKPYETIDVMLYQEYFYDNEFNLINTSKEEKGETHKFTNSYLKLRNHNRKYFNNCYYNEEKIFNIKNEINEGNINDYILEEINKSVY